MSTIPIFLDSSAPGSSVSGSGGNILNVYISPPLKLDRSKKMDFKAISGSLWNVVPNVGPNFNNNVFEFTYNSTTHTYVFPTGLYSIDDIQETLSNFLVNDGLTANLIEVEGIESTGHSTITINGTGMSINFLLCTLGGVRLLGFSTNIISNTTSGDVFVSDNIATFSKLDYFLFRLNFVNGSVYNSEYGSNIVLKALVDVPAGSQIIVEPNNIFGCQLSQREIDYVQLRITDQSGNDVDFRGEPFSLTGYIQIY